MNLLAFPVPDLLALPLVKAEKILCEAGIAYELRQTKPPREKHDELKVIPMEYVVKQLITAEHKIILVTSTKYRKEV